jgi:hypothetical protein
MTAAPECGAEAHQPWPYAWANLMERSDPLPCPAERDRFGGEREEPFPVFDAHHHLYWDGGI